MHPGGKRLRNLPLAPGAEPPVRPIEASISLAGRARELAQ